MLQQIRQYMPDDTGGGAGAGNGFRDISDSGSGSAGDSSFTNEDDESGLSAEDTDNTSSGSTSSVNLNDDNIGDAGLGVANIASSADPEEANRSDESSLVNITNVSQLDRTLDFDDDGINVGFGGDLSSPGMGTLDDLGTAESNYPDGFAQNETNETDLSEPSGSAGLGSMSGSGVDPNLNLTSQPEASASPNRQSNGKTALVTGASSGIGRELANLFAKDGYNLILVSRSNDSLQQISQEYQQQFGIQATVISRDLTDPNAPEEIYAETQRQGLTVDVLVNDAGVGEYGMFATESDLQKELSLIQLNVSALVHLTKLYLKDMVARNEGKILMLGSIASVMPHPLMAVYGATKAFIYSFSEALRNELKDTNVTVTVLMPPATDTDFFNKAGATHTVAQEQARSMSPAEVAKTGYDALMKGKDKVAVGMMAKIMTTASLIMPDSMVTQSGRNLLKSREEAKQDAQKTTIALAVGAAVIGGLWLISRSWGNGTVSSLNKSSYRSKVNSAKRSAQNSLKESLADSTPTRIDSVVDSAKGTYHDAKAAIEEAMV